MMVERNGSVFHCNEEELELLKQVDRSNKSLQGAEHPLVRDERTHNEALDRAFSIVLPPPRRRS